MCADISNAFLSEFDKDTMTCDFPLILKNIAAKDASFEMVTSNSLQTLRLPYQNKLIETTCAVVFVATELKGREGKQTLQYKDAKARGEKA